MPSNNDLTRDFKKHVWEFYEKNKRVLPWRNVNNPYEIFISEVMLQQTQVQRVIPKYENWINEFPDFKVLSQSSLQKVILFWSGLGYNRRAKFLLDSARIISTEWKGAIQQDQELLIQLPGIGK
ncbi:MAG: A/G-specific adenine glycosylase, partial [Candidatus Levybacteria bacterium]|nr:A/G-specific adenine glycosylase [Candidatus Levybacteria bacterium]